MPPETLVNRATAVGTYLATVGTVILLTYPNLYFQLQLVLLVSTVVVALVGDRYPGVAPAMSSLYVAVYLYVIYTSGARRYDLPYASMAILSLVLLMLIPLYLFMTRIQRLSDVVTSCAYLIVYVLAIAYPQSLLISMALFTSLSTLSSGTTAVISATSYSILLALTTYVGQYSATDLRELKAVPLELLLMSRTALGYEVLLRFSVALAAYLLGFLIAKLVDRKYPIATRGTLKGTALEIARRIAIATPLSLAVACTFDLKPLSLSMVLAYNLVFVGALGLVKSLQESVTLAHSYIRESRDLAEAVELKTGMLEEAIKYFKEGSLSSLENAGKIVREAKAVLREFTEILSLTIPSYPRALKIYGELSRLNTELDQVLESMVKELRELAKVPYSISHVIPKGFFAAVYEELENSAHSKTEKWKVFHSLVPRISEILEQYCDILQETFLVNIPGAYYELFGFRPVFRHVKGCSDLGVKAAQLYQDLITMLLTGFDLQVDAVISALNELAEDANRFSKLTRVYEVGNPYVLELLKMYQDHFSYARTLVSSDPLSKLTWAVDVKKNVLPNISALLSRLMAIRSKVEEFNKAIANSLEHIREALAYIDDPDNPLVELLPVLNRLLRVAFSVLGPLSEIGMIATSLYLLEKIGPLVEEYIREGLKWGYRFEDIFPLRENLRWLWKLLYGRGSGDAV